MGNICGEVDTDQELPVTFAGRAFRAEDVHHRLKGSGFTSTFQTSAMVPDVAIVCDVQLNRRGELHRAFGSSLEDYELLLLGYERWGIDCARTLEGEFAFVIWDKKQNRLACFRDHLGSRRLYYCLENGHFHFASTPLAILQNPRVPRRLNRRKLAAMAVLGGHHEYDEETFYEGICSVPPGTVLTVDRRGISKHRYWRPEIRPELVPKKDEEAFEALRQLLTESVENRLEGSVRPVTLLSGGLDSSIVTAIAARSLAAKGKDLLAFGGVLPTGNNSDLEDERTWIEEFRSTPNLKIEYVSAAGSGPFDLIDDDRNFEASFQCGSIHFLLRALEHAACAHGADVGVTGHGGEWGLTTRGDGYILELMAGMRIAPAIKTLREMKSAIGISPLRYLAGEVKRAMLPLARKRPMLYLAPPFQRECDVQLVGKRFWPDHRRVQLDSLNSNLRMHANLHAYLPGESLRWEFPLFDRRLLEYCLALPGHMKVRHGFPRYLVRKSMETLVSEKIRWRPGKVVACPDYVARYEAGIGKARKFVAAIAPDDPVRGIADVAKLEMMVALPAAPTDRWDCTMGVPITLHLICFLRQFAEFRA